MLRRKVSTLLMTALITTSFLNSKPVYANPVTKSKDNNLKEVQQVTSKSNKNKNQKVTIMYYCDADNNLEGSLLNDIEEMKTGYKDSPNLNLIALVDRSPRYSSDEKVLGEDFSDTRLYKIEHNKANRLDGKNEFPEISTTSKYEANMGDPEVLKKFIDYCKSNYEADKYVLIMANHGGGAREKSNPRLNRAICWDDSNLDKNGEADCLYMGEISDHLTEKQSVDLLAFDACLMGTAEVAYQYRPGNGGFSADTLVASSPVVWGPGFKYDKIFDRIKAGGGTNNEDDLTLGGKEQNFDPATITNEQLGALFVEEQRDSTHANGRYDQHLSFYDLKKAESVKRAIDNLAVNLSNENKKSEIEKLRGSGIHTDLMHYFDEYSEGEWVEYPYFDVYDLCEKINKSENFSSKTKDLASNAMNKLNEMIVYSFGDPSNNFKEGKNGLSIFLPNGDKKYSTYYTSTKIPHWTMQSWYNSIDTVKYGLNPYGKLSWCKDGQDPEINKVGNWFELLDSWFDKTNDVTGGVNHYQW
ncbi:clostripain [Hathewaya histolytica]|uniref:Clostripain n=2 Tax=Hathewaya histolytica TaxID=1498 RepID=CLOS_HATHI|nr:clostripain [Hathewaya histolytica]P09870.2 RecName: Full=Clostripain; AltName: Full=Clostridiopeptidase B; Contains: RecName: Full=Clostripain light chain; Contains: RecName: Full=Clostripain heavy chain; Flags: Precursor [Hathewaya histolytica]CAA45212.1 clostripain [Hathewaya histolytica]VTQ91380.1 clostripain [Hathewaya histolytica]